MPLSQIVLVHREQSEKHDGHWVEAAASPRLREERALYLHGPLVGTDPDAQNRSGG